MHWKDSYSGGFIPSLCWEVVPREHCSTGRLVGNERPTCQRCTLLISLDCERELSAPAYILHGRLPDLSMTHMFEMAAFRFSDDMRE